MPIRPALPLAADQRTGGRGHAFTGREWLFGALGDWRSRPNGRFFLLTGEPGSGKTAVAARLLEWPRGEIDAPGSAAPHPTGHLDAAHFCSVRHHSSIDPNEFAKSIAKQLAHGYPAFAKEMVAAATDGRITIEASQQVESISGDNVTVVNLAIQQFVVSGMPPEETYERLVRQPLDALYAQGFDGAITLLVDALDESLAYTGPTRIPDLVLQARWFPAPVRVIVSCRPEVELLRQLRGPDTDEHDLTAPTALGHSLDDIERHVTLTLQRDQRLTERQPGDLTVAEVAAIVQRKSRGNFLYTVKLLEMLAEQHDRPLSRELLDRLPEGLDHLYLDFLARLTAGSKNERWDIYGPVVGTLAVARAPLGERQLATFVGRSPGSIRRVLLSDLRQLLDADDSLKASERHYTLYHQSFADYLLDEDRAEEFWCEPRQQHERIAAAYLTQNPPDWAACDDYGLRHLPMHLTNGCDDRGLIELLKGAFLSAKAQRFSSYWLVLEDLRAGMAASERLRDLPARLRMAIAHGGLKQHVGELPPNAAERLIPIYALAGQVELAIDLARMIDTDWRNGRVLREIVWRLATADPDQAAALTDRIDDPFFRAEALVGVLREMTRRSPAPPALHSLTDRLLKLVNGVPADTWARYWRSAHLRDMAAALGPIDAERATSILDLADEAAHAIDEDQWRFEELRNLARMVAASHRTRSLELYEHALAAIDSMPDGDWMAKEIGSTIDELAEVDLERCLVLTRQVDSVLGSAYANAHLAHHLAVRNAAGAEIALEQGWKAATSISHAKAESYRWKQKARAKIAWAMAAQDLDAAIGFIEQELPAQSASDDAFGQIAADPIHPTERVLPLARRIVDPDGRGTALTQLARRLASDDVDAALGILDEVDATQRCHALVDIAIWHTKRGDAGAMKLVDQAATVAASQVAHPAPLLAQIGARIDAHDRARATALWQQALQVAGMDPVERVDAHATVAWGLVARRELTAALDLARLGLRSALRLKEQSWVVQARVRLIAELTRSDPDQALERIEALPSKLRPSALAEAIAVLAEVNAPRAARLFEDLAAMAPSDGWAEGDAAADAGLRALTAMLLEAARHGARNTMALAKRTWAYPRSLQDRKCDALAEASGLLATHDLEGARQLLVTVMSDPYGGGRPLGHALVAIGRRDAGLATDLGRQSMSALEASGGDRIDEAGELCQAVAAALPELALDLSRSMTEGLEAAAVRGKVIACAAAAIAATDRQRAQALVDEALRLSEEAQYNWARVGTVIQAAEALVVWDAPRAQRVADEAVRLAVGDPKSPGLASEIPAQAAVVAARAGLHQQARALMEQAIQALHDPRGSAWSREDALNALTARLEDLPEDLSAEFLQSLVRAILDDGKLLIEQPTMVIPLLLQAQAATTDSEPLEFLTEIDVALELVEEVFTG